MTFVVLNLGAGVQSTTLLLMAMAGELPRPDAAIFADTGWEPQAVYRHLDWLERVVDIPLHRVSAGNLREDILAAKAGRRFATAPFYVKTARGYGMLPRQCTDEYKIRPILRKIRELLGAPRGRPLPRPVEQWLGISLDEIDRMRDSRHPRIRLRYPLIERRMTRWDCELWLRRHGYAVPAQSACLGCPYHSDAYWREMRRRRPDEWAQVVAFDDAVREGLRGVRGQVFLHRSLRPLAALDLRSERDRGQLDLFGEECGGVCGT